MDEISCPRCKTTKYRNPSLKLMVNVCGHALCESCVELLFVRGSGSCPECGVSLRRTNFRVQLFEDASVEKEVDIRKKILRDFNKKEEDFATTREYDDYLEMVETIIFNLANNTDVEETRRQIEQFKRDNADVIRKNRSKVSHDEEYLEMLVEQELQESEIHRQVKQQEEQQAKRVKVKHKEALIDELMFSDLPAEHILATHKRDVAEEEVINKSKPLTAFSTGIKMGKQDTRATIHRVEEGHLFVYEPLLLDLNGPELPVEDDLSHYGYLSHIRPASESEKGGGFLSQIACQRALQDAFCGLYFSSLSLDSVTRKARQSMDTT